MSRANVFDQLRFELQKLRAEEQPEFKEGQQTVRHLIEEERYGEVVSDGLTEEQARERTENSVQKRLLDKVEDMIDRVEQERRHKMSRVFMPPWMRRRYNYLHIGEKSIGKTAQLSQEISEQWSDQFSNLDEYDWITPGGFVEKEGGE